jgi:uncharacterized repeat protein (TIGR01451 family)
VLSQACSIPRTVKKASVALVMSLAAFGATAGAAHAADLGFASYEANPSDVSQGFPATFSMELINDGAPRTATVTIAVASNVEVVATPAGCVLSGAAGSQTLVCTVANVSDGTIFTYQAIGRSVGAAVSSASISASGNSDGNAGNDNTPLNVIVNRAQDLSATLVPSAVSVPAGGALTYTATVTANAGSGTAQSNEVVLTINLPPTNEFEFTSATSAGNVWTCGQVGAVLTCTWAGGNRGAGAYPAISINGRVIRATSGTITANGAVSVAGALVDPINTNNAVANQVVNVQPGTDLRAGIFIAANVVVGGPPVAPPVSIRMTIVNDGPQAAGAGATIATTVPVSLTIGAMPAGCALSVRTITCTAGSLAVGASQVFRIPVSGASLATSQSLNAGVTSPSGLADGNAVNDLASIGYNVVAPTSDLTISKSKGPNPVQVGELMTSTIRVTNVGVANVAYTPSTPVVVTDAIGAFEDLDVAATDAANGSAWTCTQQTSPVRQITCSTTGTGSVAAPVVDPVSAGGFLDLVIRTRVLAGADENLSNTACTGSTGGSLHTPADTNPANDCAGAGVRATPDFGDLSIVKDLSLDLSSWTGTSPASRLMVGTGDAHYFIRLRVTNNPGGPTARTVDVRDEVSALLDSVPPGGATWAATVVAVEGSIDRGTCTINAGNPVYSCRLTDVAAGETRTVILRVSRALNQGDFQSDANVSSPDFVELVGGNNDSAAYGSVAPIADVRVNSVTFNPATIQEGVETTVTISVQNIGANTAAAVTLGNPIDSARFLIVAGSATTTAPGGNCTLTSTNFSCTLGNFTSGATYQASYRLIPVFTGAAPAGLTSTATAATSTFESSSANNQNSAAPSVTPARVDLITVVDQPANTPTVKYDPLAYEADTLLYDVNVRNAGPSRATGVTFDFTLAPAAGHTGVLQGFDASDINPANARTPGNRAAPSATCALVSGNLYRCTISPVADDNFLDPGQSVTLRLRFTTGGAPISSAITFNSSATASALEGAIPGGETNQANNTEVEPATLRPRVDFGITKTTVTGGPVNINQAVTFQIDVYNDLSSSTATSFVVTDTLPAGFVAVSASASAVGAAGLDAGSTGALDAGDCSGFNGQTLTCTLFGSVSNGSANAVRLTVVARAPYGYAGPIGTPVVNSASVAARMIGGEPEYFERDPHLPNTATSSVTVQESAIAGLVYNDLNRNSAFNTGEGITGVSMTLSGADIYGNSITGVVVSSGAGGVWRFGMLPPGMYNVVETQPANHFDREETAGTFTGAAAPTVNGTFGNAAAENTITGIVIDGGFESTGNAFREIQEVRIRGSIYRDLNDDGNRSGAGETGYAPASFPTATNHVRLEGNDIDGAPVSVTASVNGSGLFDFIDLKPSDASGYRIVQLQAPIGTYDGRDQNGAGLGNVISGSADRALAAEIIPLGQVNPGDNLTERNFGELPTVTVAGNLWVDVNTDAVRQGAETLGIAGVTLTLTGTNDLAESVTCTVTSNGSGAFSFPNAGDADPLCQKLRRGTYAVAVTWPIGIDATGATIGSLGGASGAVTGAGNPSAGSTVTSITGIVAAAAQTGTDYNFGALGGRSLTGTVYLDTNGNGAFDGGEPGLSGVGVTLSGTAVNGQNVCTLAVCAATTNANGEYTFSSLPASNPSGFTVTQQSQAAAPLNLFTDGGESLGTVNGAASGAAGADAFSGIALTSSTAIGAGYNFGERPATLSGSVFVDFDRNGGRNGADTDQSGVNVTLSGTTASGQDVCTWLSGLNPAMSCVTATQTDGSFLFPVLPASNGAGYTLTADQPAAWGDGLETAGSTGGAVNAVRGTAAANNRITGITLAAGEAATGYLFADEPGRVQGLVFVDTNNNTTREVGEPLLQGVTITLTRPDTSTDTRATDVNGAYDFDGLAAGTYSVSETQPASYGDAAGSPNTLSAVLAGGGVAMANFRETAGDITARVYEDRDRNDTDTAEPGIQGVVIELRRVSDNSLVTSLTTDSAGVVTFTGLVAGDYRLVQPTQPSAYASGTPDTISVALLAGGAASGSFGEDLGLIRGRVFIDTNNNGTDNSEPPIAGVTIELRRSSDNSLIATATTGMAGDYAFPNLLAGDYAVVEIQPAAYGSSTPNSVPVTLPPGGEQVADFGETTASFTGFVFLDRDRDGVQNGNDIRLAGGTVMVTGPGGPYTALVQADGSFALSGLVAGTYTVTQTQPAGYATGSPNVVTVVVGAGSTNPVIFAEWAGSLSGVSFVDVNGNGAQDSGEVGLAGVVLTLTGADTNGPVNRTVSTDTNGAFTFGDLQAATYSLAQVQPVGYGDTDEIAGTAGGALPSVRGQGDANNTVSGITLAAGQAATGYRFGDQPLGALTGVVFADLDRDGVQDPGERLLAGVVLTLLRPDGSVAGTATTDNVGAYVFNDVIAGAYTLVQTQPSGYGTPAGDTRPVTVPPAGSATENFAEWTATLAGLVYADSDGNLARTPGERGLAGVTLRLTGTTVTAASVDRTTTTATDGSWTFDDLVEGTYTVTETQPAGFGDGAETLGTANGNSGVNDVISGIVLGPAQIAQDYLFGEFVANASLAGTVWRDVDHDRVRDAGEPLMPGWTVVLSRGGVQLATTTTSADGAYSFTGLAPGDGYSVRFLHPGTGAPIAGARPNEDGVLSPQGVVTPDNLGGATYEGGVLDGIHLVEGMNLAEQSLPLDPNGVVYDSVTRLPVTGAVVTLGGPAGFDPAVHLLGGLGNLNQTTTADGFYQYFLLPGAPAGEYTLAVTPPAGYLPTWPSTLLPICSDALIVGASPSPLAVQAQAGAPPVTSAIGCGPVGGATTTYYNRLVLTPGVSADVVNNHLPVDPLLGGVLQVIKTTPRGLVNRGELVPYTLTVRNTLSSAIPSIDVVDRMPAGFGYREGTATLDGVSAEPQRDGRDLVWTALSFAPNEERTITLALGVGAGVREGDHDNLAFARNPGTGTALSNIGQATVRLMPDELFDCSDLIGKVFDDQNGNGRQDDGEPGLAGVRIATVNGLLVTTDAEGRYHIACAAVPMADRGSNVPVKLDVRTLPLGYRVTTENPEVVRATRGRVIRANFGAALMQAVRIDVDLRVFAPQDADTDSAFTKAFEDALAGLTPVLEAKPSVLRLVYVRGADETVLDAKRRLAAIARRIEDLWDDVDGRCRLILETEVFEPNTGEGGQP